MKELNHQKEVTTMSNDKKDEPIDTKGAEVTELKTVPEQNEESFVSKHKSKLVNGGYALLGTVVGIGLVGALCSKGSDEESDDGDTTEDDE